MPIHYNLETDVRYRQGTAKGVEVGIEKGIEIGKEKGIEEGIKIGAEKTRRLLVESLLRETDLSDEKIARIAKATLAFVEQARRELEAL